MNITFENHKGIYDQELDHYIFYGIHFDNMLTAIKTLKELTPGEKYFMWCYKYHVGVIHEKTKNVLIDNRWLPNEDFAEMYIDMKK
jgi:hypothetical protein